MKLAIITGGSRGLGAALIQHYSEQADWEVLELSRSGTGKYHIHCDLADPAMVATFCEGQLAQVSARPWDELIFVNNAAALLPISRVEQLSYEQIQQHITINQISAFTLLSGIMAAFRDNPIQKTLINISSGAASKGYPGWSLYCASKAANENFIQAVAAGEADQLHPFTAVNYDPGVMDTAMQSDIRASDINHFPDLARFQAMKQEGVLRTPDQVAQDLISQISLGLTSGSRYSVN